jgi:hypothetical protein
MECSINNTTDMLRACMPQALSRLPTHQGQQHVHYILAACGLCPLGLRPIKPAIKACMVQAMFHRWG